MSGHCDFCEIWHSGPCCHPQRGKIEALTRELEILAVVKNANESYLEGNKGVLDLVKEELSRVLDDWQVLTFKVTNVTTERDVANEEIERLNEATKQLQDGLSVRDHQLTAAKEEIERLKDKIDEIYKDKAGASR